jgi:hypothetical protein
LRGLAEWKLEQIKLQTAERVRRYRARKQGNVTVTEGNGVYGNVTPFLDKIQIRQEREEKSSSNDSAESVQAALQIGLAPVRTPEKKKRSGPLMNADTLEQFERNPAYEGIDVNQEAWKFKSWCQANKKPESVKRFTNWLNRIV